MNHLAERPNLTVREVQALYEEAAAAVRDDDFCDDVMWAWATVQTALQSDDAQMVGKIMLALYKAQIERIAMRIDCREVPQNLMPLPVANKALVDYVYGQLS